MIVVDLLPYFLLLLLTAVIPKVTKQYVTVLFLVFFLFSGFRYGVGWDYFNYLEIIENGGWMISRTERLPRYLLYFCRNNGLTQTFFIVTSFVTLLCYFSMLKKESKNPAVSLFVFLCVPMCFLDTLSVIRFAMAVSLVFLACHYGYEKKYKQYFALMIVAILTHNAALFGFLTIPFVVKEISFSMKTNLNIFIVCFVIGTIAGSFSIINAVFNVLADMPMLSDIFGGAEKYMYDKGNTGFSKTPYVFALLNIINIVSYWRGVNSENGHRLAHYLTMFNLGCSVMFLFSFNAIFASRVSMFFLVFLLLVVPYYKKQSYQQMINYAVFIFIFFYQLTINASNSDFIGRINCWLPYRMNFSF